MKILVMNCGSSSLKYQLIDMTNENVMAKGLCERIGIEGSKIKHEGKEKYETESPMPTHTEAIRLVIDMLVSPEYGVISSIDEIHAAGHRVVHGGENFTSSTIVTPAVKAEIKECADLAPLHNPANLIGIDVCEQLLPGKPQVVVFDTAFHQTMPEKAYLYALPYEYYEKYKVRRYGFHGTSHKYVSDRTASLLGKKLEDLKVITCHMGNGASVAAISGGKVVDTSMGLTPLEGLVMGTRSGDMDPAIMQFVMGKESLNIKEMENVLNKNSGVLGISGVSSDFRDIEGAADRGNARAKAALDVYYYRVAKYIGAYVAAMNGVDAVVFTAGLGENSARAREAICSYLGYLGLEVDTEKNNVRGVEVNFAKDSSKVAALLIPTNEELVIARDTVECLK